MKYIKIVKWKLGVLGPGFVFNVFFLLKQIIYDICILLFDICASPFSVSWGWNEWSKVKINMLVVITE